MDNNSIKDNIRKIRKSRGITQEEMADMLGISLTAYKDLERGATNVVNNNVLKIAEIVGISAETVLGYGQNTDEDKINDVRAEYGTKVENLQTRINDLEKIVASLEDVIATKNEIISILKKNIDEKR